MQSTHPAVLEANRTLMPVQVDDLAGVSIATNSSISLDSKGINDEDDEKQEV